MKYTLLSMFCILAFCSCGIAGDGHFVGVSRENPNYLCLDNGEAFVPRGYNMCFPRHYKKLSEDECFVLIEEHFKMLSENGGNYTRIWLSHPFYEIEDEQAGKYNPAKIARIDRFMALAKKYGVRVKMCIEHFRNIKDYKPNENERGLNVFLFARPAYDGEFKSMNEYFSSPKGRELFLKRFKVFADKYGNDPIVFGWELWNENNCVSAKPEIVREWQKFMLAKIRQMCPKQMVMNSYGSFDGDRAKSAYEFYMDGYSGDIAQIHRYLDEGAKYEICKGPADLFSADAVAQIRKISPDRPVLLAETGGVLPKHAGPWRFYDSDSEGVLFHDTFYTPFFCGAAGPGQPWHWDLYVLPHKLWRHVGIFSKFIDGTDPVSEKFKPVRADSGELRVYALKGSKTILAFIRDSKNDWKSEFVSGVAPRTVSKAEVDLSPLVGGRRIARAEVFDLWKGGSVDVDASKSAKVSLPDFKRSCGLKITLSD